MRILPAKERAADQGSNDLTVRVEITISIACASPSAEAGSIKSRRRRAQHPRIEAAQAAEIRRLWNGGKGLTQVEIGRRFNTSQPHVSQICRDVAWPEPNSGPVPWD